MRLSATSVVISLLLLGNTISAASGAGPAEQMVEVARALVPPNARPSLDPSDLRVARCGTFPTYPCIQMFFTSPRNEPVTTRLSTLRALARSAGWRVAGPKPFGTGLALELTRGPLHARYAISRDTGPASRIIGLDVFGPPDAPPGPSAAQRRSWSPLKRAYVARADAVCAATLGRVTSLAEFTSSLLAASRLLESLTPPPSEATRVQAFLQPLRRLVRAAEVADAAPGEEVLPAAVAVGQHVKDFELAAARYGLTRCAVGS